jgi:predicted component of type VI protein secretion system
MKLSLLVVASRISEGKVIPVTRSPFVIGRSHNCHLRPASAAVSNRHCAIWQKGERVIVRDLGSSNGTFVNGQRVYDRKEIQDGDRLQVGPLSFQACLQKGPAVNQQAPMSLSKPPADGDDLEDAAALLLSEIDGARPSLGRARAAGRIIVEQRAFADFSAASDTMWTASWRKPLTSVRFMGDTAAAADDILKRYLRRSQA